MGVHGHFLAKLESVKAPLTAYVRQLLWNPSDLDDALQTTVLTAFQKFSSFQDGTDFRSWVFRIASFTVFNINRKSATIIPTDVEQAEIETPIEIQLEREQIYDELLQQPERLLQTFDEDVRRAVLTLAEHERAVLLLVTIGEFRCREVADILEMPIGSVMGYLARARAKLREYLAEFARKRGWVRRTP